MVESQATVGGDAGDEDAVLAAVVVSAEFDEIELLVNVGGIAGNEGNGNVVGAEVTTEGVDGQAAVVGGDDVCALDGAVVTNGQLVEWIGLISSTLVEETTAGDGSLGGRVGAGSGGSSSGGVGFGLGNRDLGDDGSLAAANLGDGVPGGVVAGPALISNRGGAGRRRTAAAATNSNGDFVGDCDGGGSSAGVTAAIVVVVGALSRLDNDSLGAVLGDDASGGRPLDGHGRLLVAGGLDCRGASLGSNLAGLFSSGAVAKVEFLAVALSADGDVEEAIRDLEAVILRVLRLEVHAEAAIGRVEGEQLASADISGTVSAATTGEHVDSIGLVVVVNSQTSLCKSVDNEGLSGLVVVLSGRDDIPLLALGAVTVGELNGVQVGAEVTRELVDGKTLAVVIVDLDGGEGTGGGSVALLSLLKSSVVESRDTAGEDGLGVCCESSDE